MWLCRLLLGTPAASTRNCSAQIQPGLERRHVLVQQHVCQATLPTAIESQQQELSTTLPHAHALEVKQAVSHLPARSCCPEHS